MAYTSGMDTRDAVSAYLEGGLEDLSEEEAEVLKAFAVSVVADFENPTRVDPFGIDDENETDEEG